MLLQVQMYLLEQGRAAPKCFTNGPVGETGLWSSTERPVWEDHNKTAHRRVSPAHPLHFCSWQFHHRPGWLGCRSLCHCTRSLSSYGWLHRGGSLKGKQETLSSDVVMLTTGMGHTPHSTRPPLTALVIITLGDQPSARGCSPSAIARPIMAAMAARSSSTTQACLGGQHRRAQRGRQQPCSSEEDLAESKVVTSPFLWGWVLFIPPGATAFRAAQRTTGSFLHPKMQPCHQHILSLT